MEKFASCLDFLKLVHFLFADGTKFCTRRLDFLEKKKIYHSNLVLMKNIAEPVT